MAGERVQRRPWMPSLTQLAPLLLLPLLAWVVLDTLDLTPQPGSQPVLVFSRVLQASGRAVSSMAGASDAAAEGAEEETEEQVPSLPPPPPPMQLDYWQKHLLVANATGLAPPVFRGNWMEAVHAHMRWFEDDGKPRQMRPDTWWGYADPAPAKAARPAGSARKRTQGGPTRKRKPSSGGASRKPGGKVAGGAGSRAAGGSGGSGGAGRRLASAGSTGGGSRKLAAEGDEPDSWWTSMPELQTRGPAIDVYGEERSHYLPWIEHDLQPWKDGIEQADLDRAASLASPQGPYCYGDHILFQVIGGRLYVDFKTSNRAMADTGTRGADGWFPGNEGAGLAAAKGRVPHVMLLLLDVLRVFPGQVPDVSVMLQTSDFPCMRINTSIPDMQFRNFDIPVPEEHYNGRPIPMMGFNRKEGFLDLMFPDYSFTGHEYSQITDPTGRVLNGWPQQLDVIATAHAVRPLEKRRAKVMWRGRASDEPRDEVRRRFQACPDQLEAAGHLEAKKLFDVVAPPLHEITSTTLLDNGRYRYPVYIDAGAYASNLKQKLAAGSPLLMVTHRYHEWYTRALKPGWTHIDVPDDDTMCEDVYEKVTLMEEMIAEHAGVVRRAKHRRPWLQPHADSWFAHPWGVNWGSDESAFEQLRNWTLAQRGIAVGGVNAYEDSELYVPPPEPPADFSQLGSDDWDPDSGNNGGGGGDGNKSGSGGGGGDRDGSGGSSGGGSDSGSGRNNVTAGSRGGSGTDSSNGTAGSAAGASDAEVLGPEDSEALGLSALWSGAVGGLRSLTPEGRRQRAEAAEVARQQQQAEARFQLRMQEAEAARKQWIGRQAALRKAVPWNLWARANQTWGSPLLPWEIGAFGQLFMRDRLRMRDVRLYVRDLLTEYSKLQKFKPTQSRHARCMDWRRLLLEFEWPHYSEDLDQLLHFYPYMRQPFNYDCGKDEWDKQFPEYSPGHDGDGDQYKADFWWQQRWKDEVTQRQQQAGQLPQDGQQ